mmetsp:Transcript_787/g.2714  ORF Transcript_787/g.2714 Transcript_787/m.2714 type:complete len:269 (+) Transcript_787:344-1150(+)|eukprot:CAMPEP_0174856810 /NCGR_PEP_ID=MMETSP1114-20130205/36228_1 /TAXON_ID=312471 /ORGANISM="Neobodo designis, Strain CCAP 1951/1" /LENGTH=268 /DNA_ID=CAMNT_0016091615 /DNA_START=290 /DNA_END=1096 /DNA_ORIENTATION=+
MVARRVGEQQQGGGKRAGDLGVCLAGMGRRAHAASAFSGSHVRVAEVLCRLTALRMDPQHESWVAKFLWFLPGGYGRNHSVAVACASGVSAAGSASHRSREMPLSLRPAGHPTALRGPPRVVRCRVDVAEDHERRGELNRRGPTVGAPRRLGRVAELRRDRVIFRHRRRILCGWERRELHFDWLQVRGAESQGVVRSGAYAVKAAGADLPARRGVIRRGCSAAHELGGGCGGLVVRVDSELAGCVRFSQKRSLRLRARSGHTSLNGSA